MLANAIAVRLDVGPDGLRPHLIAAVVGTALWRVIGRWVSDSGSDEELLLMIDDAFALLESGLA